MPRCPVSRYATTATIITHHAATTLSVPQGIIGNAALGGTFYEGALYPPQFQNKYFAIDFGQNWIKVADIDTLGNLVSLVDFADQTSCPWLWWGCARRSVDFRQANDISGVRLLR